MIETLENPRKRKARATKSVPLVTELTEKPLVADVGYPPVFHSPGLEPWICSLLKTRANLTDFVLDVGCGLGFWGFLTKTYIAPRAYVVGIDISAEKLRTLKSLRIYDEALCSDVNHLPFRECMFDTVLCVEILSWLRNVNKILSDIERVAVKEGLIIVASPCNSVMLKVLMKSYNVYSYMFRGFVLINVSNKKAVTMWRSRWNRFLCLLALLYHRLSSKRAVKYVLAFKVL